MKQHPIVNAILVALFSASLGFGVSQMSSVAEVREHTVEIRQIKKDVVDERGRTDQRIFQIAELVKATIESDKAKQQTLQDFIQLLRVQNELLQRNSGIIK